MTVRILALVGGLALATVPATGPAAAAAPAAGGSVFRDTRGIRHDSREWADARAVVLFFIMPDCPISQGYVPEMNRIQQAYVSRGVRFYAVQSDPAAREPAIRQHVEAFGYRFAVLLDPAQRLVRRTGATTTPEAVVMGPSGAVLYQGRIDDRIVSFGTRRPQATRHDLREALDAVLAGRAVAQRRTQPVGCIIPPPVSGASRATREDVR